METGKLKERARAEVARLGGIRAVVVGAASTGAAAARFLARAGASVTVTDDKKAEDIECAGELRRLGVELKAGGSAGAPLDGVSLVIVSPGVPFGHPLLAEARRAGADVISDIELAWRCMDAPVYAVAGTNGKTTTATLLGRVLSEAGKKVFVGGNIGTPAIEYVDAGGGADLCVLEISSFHLETTRTFNPRVGVLLNITEDHLDRYDDFNHYAATKWRLFENQGEGDLAVVNVNDPVIAARVKSSPAFTRGRVVPFTVEGGLDYGLYLSGGFIIYRGESGTEVYPTDGIRLKGLHNMENVMAVIACARAAGVGPSDIMKTLACFSGLHHRMEFVRELHGVAYIDDSKGTNIGALQMALRGLPGPVVLIAGGRDKGGDYSALKDLIREKVRLMVLIGEAALRIRAAFAGATEAVMAESLEAAVKTAHARSSSGDTVLLSPACSSFDMFKSYRERGERFKELVRAL
ncbi:MAG: UDP-N-acetylmuramoyl-L-alanine--D-glutamate ligase [Deltaproteobacteria bacterium]|nr:UDP-N-acetylmuramoyl-L-alanine--D-glutamate ligase [Deltaproteobacteria bacterium]